MALSDTVSFAQVIEDQDKVEHFAALFVLAMLFGTGASIQELVFYSVALFAAAIGIEVLQAAITDTREGDLVDALLSLAGAGAGLLCVAGLNRLGATGVPRTASA